MKVSVKFWICTPAWDTEIVRVGAPVAVTVIVPVRELAPVLAVALIVKEPLLLPLAGDTVSHEVALLDTFQALLENTFTFMLSAKFDGVQVLRDRLRLPASAAWDTGIVRVTTPGIDTVIVPFLAVEPVFADALITKDALPLPLDRDTVSHDVALLDTVQLPLDVTFTVAWLEW